MSPNHTVAKSYNKKAEENPIIEYCTKVSVRQEKIQKDLLDATLAKAERGGMIGAPEVLQFGQNLIHLIGAKRALDVGTFTGASALAWALALPEDGQVVSMDVNHSNLNNIGKPILQQRPELLKKIDFRLAPALETLDSLIAAGESSKFDFAFIDANKEDYPEYYEKSVQLLRSGGVILIDNALHSGPMAGSILDPQTPMAKAIDATNRRAFEDDRVWNSLLNLGDGTHVIFKK